MKGMQKNLRSLFCLGVPCLAMGGLLLLLTGGCAKPGAISASRQNSQESTDPWVLGTPASDSPVPALLWNGLLGIRVSRTGNGFGPDGKPLGFFMIDEYQPSGEEKIIEMPNPILVNWSVGNQIYDGDKSKEHDFVRSGGTPLSPTGKISDYRQSLDMKTSLLSTSWTQQTDGGGKVSYRCDTLVHPTERVIAQRWTVQTEKPTTFTVKSLDYSGPTDDQKFVGGDPDQSIALSASKSRAVTTQVSLSGANPGARVSVDGFRIQEGNSLLGKPIVFERVLSFGAHSPSPLPEFDEKNAAMLKKVAPEPMSFDQVLQACTKEWAQRWKTDIEIDGPAKDQQMVRSFLFYLQSAIAPGGAHSISPFGLSDQQYNGHVFWDADVWVLPAIDLLFPKQAKSIAEYRLLKAEAAERNFSGWFAQSKGASEHQALGVKFPWESSVTGKETAPGDSKLEDHITGSVVWGLNQAAALGLAPHGDVDNLAALAANFYYTRGTRKPGSAAMTIEKVMSPDENHIGDNDLYTNLLASWLVSGRQWNSNQTSPFKIPHDAQGLITYDGDRFRGYKQAAAVLSIYPLQYPPAELDSKTMLNRFESAVIKNGPAMSDSLHGLIWARAGDPEKGYQDWQKSWKPFTDNAFDLFSEKRSKSQTYFTTGAGGCLQTVLYGFLGYRVDSSPQPGSAWQIPIMGKQVLSLKPHLPSEWRSVKVKGLNVLNTLYSFSITHQGVQVRPGE
jgi:trehalose/maltose hydrolase-like predicted phosphorylase